MCGVLGPAFGAQGGRKSREWHGVCRVTWGDTDWVEWHGWHGVLGVARIRWSGMRWVVGHETGGYAWDSTVSSGVELIT